MSVEAEHLEPGDSLTGTIYLNIENEEFNCGELRVTTLYFLFGYYTGNRPPSRTMFSYPRRQKVQFVTSSFGTAMKSMYFPLELKT